MKIYRCNVCKKIIVVLDDSGVDTICCGKKMEEVKEELRDSDYFEKHLPMYNIKDNKLNIYISSVQHPMEAMHYIKFIIIETTKGFYVRYFMPLDEPKFSIYLPCEEKLLAIYSYCNVHGLWKTIVK